jgi:dTDP-L-rhamnose 4-epimerase
MGDHVLITGGAGFIGSHLADELLRQGHRVRVLDNLNPQVHGPDARRPKYLARDVELQVGDIRNRDAVTRALHGVDVVFHFAALVGVGQSMYRISDYTSVNEEGTATLLEVLVKRPPRKLVVASSMSIYGEGLYRRADGQIVPGTSRPLPQLERREWELLDERGDRLEPVPTHEAKPPVLESVYALGKYAQERMSLLVGRAYGISTTALRFFNVFGPRQALSNPYTGVLAIFASRLLNGNSPLIFEDGNQRRDMVSVYDIARACLLAMNEPRADQAVFNIGSGRAISVREIAERIAKVVGRSEIQPEITGTHRKGDIRHCFADISAAREVLGYEPRVSLEEGLRELAGWLEGQSARDQVVEARAELVARGLTL